MYMICKMDYVVIVSFVFLLSDMFHSFHEAVYFNWVVSLRFNLWLFKDAREVWKTKEVKLFF